MNLPTFAKARFEKFMSDKYGVMWEETKFEGEVKRCMINDRLIIIRTYDTRRSAESLEVFCSDRDLIKEIELEFLQEMAELGLMDKKGEEDERS